MNPSSIRLLLLALALGGAVARAQGVPPAEQNLVLTGPIRSWDEAIPLGNGLLGGLLWGEGHLIRLSLDRGDLWDERPAIERGWWKKRTWKAGGDWDQPYNGVTPTKLPAGRLEITLDPSQRVKTFELNLATAEGRAQFEAGGQLEVFYSAASPVALLRIPGPEPRGLALIPSGARKEAGNAGPSSGGAVAKLGYPPAKHGQQGRAQWYVQDAADGLKYCACLETRRVGHETLVAVTVTSTNDDADPLALAKRRCAAALAQGYVAMLEPHAAWWRQFWAQSSLSVPEPEIQKYYVLCRSYYGAASRRGAPPMPLQGVWTADNGGLPPWKGDYHNDLNTQMTYIGYHAAGNFDEGACYLDFLVKLTPVFTEFARDFYGTPGLSSPGVMSLAGQPLGGWGQYSLSPTMTSWNAHLFYLHWRYTMDEPFLRDQAYPWCKAAGDCLRALLQPDASGLRKLFRSSSPEIFDNSARAWLIPNSNYDLFCMKMQFLALTEMADALGRADEAKLWRETAAALGDFHTDASGLLLLDAKTPLPYSHRHLSNIMGIYPFNLITTEGGERDRQRIRASLAQWDQLGTAQWCGYSFSWMSGLKARAGDAEGALRNLDIFVKAFILRNGFHVNGDQTRSGFSSMTYRPFTLEGNFAALQAVHEMLLQSWSPTPGQRDTEIIRLFPATPWRWHDVAFTDLRAEGGHRVSAKREKNATTWFRVVAGKDGVVRLRDNFGGRTPRWNRAAPGKRGDNFEVALKKGESLEATLITPREFPAPPADLAEPVVVKKTTGRIPANHLPLRIGAARDGSNRFKGEIARDPHLIHPATRPVGQWTHVAATVDGKTEQLNPPDPAWSFKIIPRPSRSDAARDSRVAAVGNRPVEACLSPDGLHNGVLPWQGKQTRDFFAFSHFNTNGGRIVMDLGKVQPVAAVAAYCWQGRHGPGFIKGQRAPQVYTLYGSPAASPDAHNLTGADWTRIAEVDTRPNRTGKDWAGQHGSFIRDDAGALLGHFRWLVWEVRRTHMPGVKPEYSSTWFAELDVHTPETLAKAGDAIMAGAGLEDIVLSFKARIVAAVKEGSLVVHALPVTLQTESLDLEDLVAGLSIHRRVASELGIPLSRAGKMTDVPSHSWVWPTLLKHAGIDFLHIGVNACNQKPDVPLLCNWEGPDGSRLLTFHNQGYGSDSEQGCGLYPPKDWPCKHWLAMINSSDNEGRPTQARVRALLAEVKKNFPNTRLRLGKMEDFADGIFAEEKAGAKVPVLRADMPDSWIHGMGSMPVQDALAHQGRAELMAAGALDTSLRIWGQPRPDIRKKLFTADENAAKPQCRIGRLGGVADPAKDFARYGNRTHGYVNTGAMIADADGRGVAICPLDHGIRSFGEKGLCTIDPDYAPTTPVAQVSSGNKTCP